MIALIISLCSGAIVYAVSVMYAGIGETFSERAGIMNLGVEGVMLMGAVSGYITAVHTQNLFLSTFLFNLCICFYHFWSCF